MTSGKGKIILETSFVDTPRLGISSKVVELGSYCCKPIEEIAKLTSESLIVGSLAFQVETVLQTNA